MAEQSLSKSLGGVTKEENDDFEKDLQRATMFYMHSHQESECKKLHEELDSVPGKFHGLPFHEYIQESTPILALKSATERLLWHQ